MDDKINLADKLALFDDHFAPRTVATLNDYKVMLVKVQGEFVWHSHRETAQPGELTAAEQAI